MHSNSTRHPRINQLVALALLALCLFQLPTQTAEATSTNTIAAQAPPPVNIVDAVAFITPVGIARGQTLRTTVANLVKLEGREQDPVEVSARVLLYDAQGVVIAQTEARTVPIDWMQTFDFNREAIPLPGEPGTGRLQVRAVLKVRCTNVTRREAKTIAEKAAQLLPASLELFDNTTGQTQSGVSILEFAVENVPNN
jgi:uncharacterized protein YcfL